MLAQSAPRDAAPPTKRRWVRVSYSLVIGNEPELGERRVRVGRVARLCGKRWRLRVSAGEQSSGRRTLEDPVQQLIGGWRSLVHCTKLRRRPVWLLFSGRGWISWHALTGWPWRTASASRVSGSGDGLWVAVVRSATTGLNGHNASKAQALFLASYCASAAHWQADGYGISRVADDHPPAPPVVKTSARKCWYVLC